MEPADALPETNNDHLDRTAIELVSLLKKFAFIHSEFFLYFYTNKLYDKLPADWRSVFDKLNEKDIRKFPRLLPVSNEWPELLQRLVNKYRRLRLRRVSHPWTSPSNSPEENHDNETSVETEAKARMDVLSEPQKATEPVAEQKEELACWVAFWMKPKKKHEVIRMSNQVLAAMALSNCSTILDIGSGEGYLSRVLSFIHNFNVVGIDGNSLFRERSTKRSVNIRNLLHRAAAAATETATSSTPPTSLTGQLLHLDGYIDPSMDATQLTAFLDPLVKENHLKPDNLTRLGLVGLHCCGDLTPTMIKMFLSSSTIKTLVVAGCCYFKMKGDKHSKTGIYPTPNFPLSAHVRALTDGLPHCSFRAACESIDTWENQTDSELDVLQRDAWRRFYLEFLVAKNRELFACDCTYRIKGFNSDVPDFATYCERAIPRLVFTALSSSNTHTCQFPGNKDKHSEYLRSLSSTDFNAMERQCEDEGDLCAIRTIYALRCLAGELIEDLIAIDRLLFLREHDGITATLVPLFDPTLSPRNLVLIAHKKGEPGEASSKV